MKSNRADLAALPEFAADHGAAELDVRFVSPTPGVDVEPELLSDVDPRAERRARGGATTPCGGASSSRPIRSSRPRGRSPGSSSRGSGAGSGASAPGSTAPSTGRYAWYQGLFGCAYPDRNYVIRPNGAVNPCIYWEGDPIGFYPADGARPDRAPARRLKRIRDGLRSGHPIGTCATCGERRTALYRLRGAPAPPPAVSPRLPTLLSSGSGAGTSRVSGSNRAATA